MEIISMAVGYTRLGRKNAEGDMNRLALGIWGIEGKGVVKSVLLR